MESRGGGQRGEVIWGGRRMVWATVWRGGVWGEWCGDEEGAESGIENSKCL